MERKSSDRRRIMLVAGEASGDLHGASLVTAVRELSPNVQFYGVGGRRLRSAGVELLFDLEHMSLMGITEIVAGLRQAWRILRTLKKSLLADRPSALVLIDYPDFNLRLAKAARQAGIPVFYYICPQIWAWRVGRVQLMGKYVDRRVVVFPFEVEFYKQHGLHADFVGHPLLDMMGPPRLKSMVKADLGFDPDRPLLLLMPGSRKTVAGRLLPVLLETARRMRQQRPDLSLALAQADTLSMDFLSPFLEKGPDDIRVLAGKSHDLQNAADIVVVASGTSTVETALMLTPMVVVYRMGALTYWLGRRFVKTNHVAMANLIAGQRVVPEPVSYTHLTLPTN